MANFDLKSPALQKMLLAVLLAGGALSLYFFTHFVPFGYPNTRDQLGTLRADYEKKSTELARARASVADLPRFESEYAQLHQRWELASELLPTDRQLAAMLRKITLAGQQTGVQFVAFRPAAPRPQEYHTEMPVQIQVSGGYHQVGSFLAELANLRRIVTVSNLRLANNTGKQDGTTTTAEFTCSAYSLNTAPAQAAAAAAAAGTPPADDKKGATHARKS